jgi:hypothetical protein
MWRRHNLRPSTAIGMLMAVGLLFQILLGWPCWGSCCGRCWLWGWSFG